jgi:Carboxypeptidase regulatory-like domain
MIALTMLYPSSTRAQVTNATGTIQGTVTDSSGSAVPGAKVTLTQPSTGSSKVITATGSGYYSAGSLVPGQYTVTVEAGGFAKTSEDLTVRVGVSTNGDVKLGIGAASIMVEVQASAIQVDTQQTQIAGVLNQEQIANLPVNGRNFLDLAQLQPGVQIQDGTNFDPTKNGFESISFGGRSGRTARIELDGLDISDENVGTTTQNISQTAIQEFQVAQSNLDITTSITSSGSVNGGTCSFQPRRNPHQEMQLHKPQFPPTNVHRFKRTTNSRG